MTNLEKVKLAKAWLKNAVAWPGGYTIALYLSDGERLCRECALENWASIVNSTLHGERDGWAILGTDIYWEGPTELCAQCGHEFESEYGDPDPQDDSDE